MFGTELKGGPTQDEILAIDIVKLGLKKGDIFADIGCGTGKVSVAASMIAKQVFAIDRRPEAIKHARTVIRKAGVDNITFFEGEALDFLTRIEKLDCAFVGGSGELEEVLEILAQKVSGSIVVNAVLIHTVDIAISSLKRLGIFKEALQVQVSRSHALGEGMMFRPSEQVYIIVGGR
ncbi:MAG: precorrin-6Y C5,15-methyltransferase (decarboxylating) subunit CbiT [Methanomicrobiales archaeon]|nr:precorrin-6Y C5,15-methyltransferase (decarboxylating) subunit CbiT [Methanomicrobiales archaeon]